MPFEISARGRRFMDANSMASQFTGRISAAQESAAKAATDTSKIVYERWLGARPVAPARNGRPTTEGAFPSFLRWQPSNNGNVTFEAADLKEKAPYYLIQEIGTGQSARILNPAGEISVRSQRGRSIPLSLYWGNAGGTHPTPPTRGNGTQQLYLVENIADPAIQDEFRRRRSGVIRKEIKGKHYIRDGGIAGFTVLRDELIAEARKAFR